MIPYRILAAFLAALALVVGVALGYRALVEREQQAGYDRAVGVYKEKLAEAERAARKREQELTEQRDKAIENANEREKTIRDMAASVGTASVGLRDAIAASRRALPDYSTPAARVAADTYATLFDDCQGRYRSMAEKAQRHASDVKTLIESWPSNSQ